MGDKNFDGLNDALNTSHEVQICTSSDISNNQIEKIQSLNDEIKKDYDYTRANLYSLIEKGQEAINGIMDLAAESDQPRAYEVAGQLIKSVGDVTDKLVDLQKKIKDIEDVSEKTTTNNVTNNALFVGSTAELSKLLKQGFLNNKEES